MPPSKWDEEEESASPPPVVVPRRRFDDEEEEDVLDSWDAAEDSEVEREKAKKAAEAEAKAKALAAANKKTKAQRIEELREQRRQLEGSDDSDSEDEAERRARLRRTEQEADLAHAADLLGDVDLKRNKGAPKAVVVTDARDPTNAIDLSAMPLFKPVTKDQFTRLTETLLPLLTPHSKKPHYALWAQDFTRRLVKELPSAEIKKIASALTTASNEKMREERAADKGNKKTKAAKTKISLNASRDVHRDSTNYDGDDGLDDDDFM
ncbi:Translation initiation factor eIF3 subunit [Penicillium sp. DV-2018c]|nr:Translation initiation factor eIF3 subunit [Penicillium sp. DV-2018c]KAJ5582791.1 Translation initiation factor eIF3 subunit [Penicillium sp. DV-2018c]